LPKRHRLRSETKRTVGDCRKSGLRKELITHGLVGRDAHCKRQSERARKRVLCASRAVDIYGKHQAEHSIWQRV